MTTLPLFISPCPNDTFCFYAMISGDIDTEGLRFKVHLEDVEQLNNSVLHSDPAICKISYQVLPAIAHRYRMLPCGSALGFGNGPLFVSNKPLPTITSETRIAIPGLHTTAAFLLKYAYPQAVNTHPILFSDISGAILRNQFDAGVLIHEGRFVYKQQGLHLIADLGLCWEKRTGLPIPLGGIAVSRNLPDNVQQKIARIVHRSILYAQEHPDAGNDYIRSHAQEIDNEVIRKHIELFVNEYTLSLGSVGRAAVEALIKAVKNVYIPDLFVPLVI